MKTKIDFHTNSNIKNTTALHGSINEFKNGYQPRSNLIKDENNDLLADSHHILNRWNLLLSAIEYT
jgi:hypothetical protein